MDPIRTTSSYPDYPIRPRDTAAPKIVPPPDLSRREGADTPVTDNGHMRDYLQAKPEQVKNREIDEQVTRQRVDDKRMGTLFDLRS